MTPFEMTNHTRVTEFIFLGFSNHPNLQGVFFLVFLQVIQPGMASLRMVLEGKAESSQSGPQITLFPLSGCDLPPVCPCSDNGLQQERMSQEGLPPTYVVMEISNWPAPHLFSHCSTIVHLLTTLTFSRLG